MSEEMHVGLHVKCVLSSSISDFMMICSEVFEFFYLHTCLILITITHSFLEVIQKKLHLLLQTPFGCLTIGGLPPMQCFSVVRAELYPCQFAFCN
jgi:hypothetical protein